MERAEWREWNRIFLHTVTWGALVGVVAGGLAAALDDPGVFWGSGIGWLGAIGYSWTVTRGRLLPTEGRRAQEEA